MADRMSPEALKSLLTGNTQFAFIDVREAGEYNTSHIPGSSLISRRHLEFQLPLAVPYKGTHVILCDDDGRRVPLAAATVERMGYRHVSVLDGGINRWVSRDYPTEWGSNVPSKDFGEKVEVVHHVPELEATELHERMARGDKLVILDTRTPEEYQRFCIPGGRSVPGGELALRITDITKDLAPDTTIIVNCAGRTRSIIGTRVLQRMGLQNVYGLKNGTSGWLLAGYQLETGADRVTLPPPSPEGVAAAEAYAARLAQEDGVRYLDIAALQAMMARREQETVYLIDVRTQEEYAAGHIPGFRWFPGGQAVQRSDDVAVVHNCPIVFACDRMARATSRRPGIARWVLTRSTQSRVAQQPGRLVVCPWKQVLPNHRLLVSTLLAARCLSYRHRPCRPPNRLWSSLWTPARTSPAGMCLGRTGCRVAGLSCALLRWLPHVRPLWR